jgi:hypothetical protein
MSPSSYPIMTENRMEEFNTCLQQGNSSYSPYHRTTIPHLKTPLSACSIVDDDEQIKRNKLIQAATNRLHQKRLEIKFQAMMAQIVEMQSQLDIIKMDTSTSLQLLPSSNISESQLLHFEKRLVHHKMELQHILQCKKEDAEPIDKKPSYFSSPSSLASSISSLLSLCSKDSNNNKDSVLREEESDYSILGGSTHYHQKRRKRRHHQQKKEQHGCMQNSAPTITSTISSLTISDFNATLTSYDSSEDYDNSNESIVSSFDCYDSTDNSILVQPLHQEFDTDVENRHELLALHSIFQSAVHFEREKKEEQDRNALDDVLSFLNEISSNSNDDIFIQDIYKILDHQKQQIAQKLPVAASTSTIVSSSILNTLKYLLSKGLQWIRFTIVMALAIIINLKKGPKPFLL